MPADRPDALLMFGSPATAASASLLRRARIPSVEMWELPAAPIDAAATEGRRRMRRV